MLLKKRLVSTESDRLIHLKNYSAHIDIKIMLDSKFKINKTARAYSELCWEPQSLQFYYSLAFQKLKSMSQTTSIAFGNGDITK